MTRGSTDVEVDDNVIHLLPDDLSDRRRQITHEVTERWLRAYATAVGDQRPELVDLEHPGGIVAHPGFANCLEWPLVEFGSPGIILTPWTLSRGLHTQHEVEFHDDVRGAQRLTTTAELVIAEQRSSAVHVATQFRTTDQAGKILVSTRLHMLYPHVRLSGGTLNGGGGIVSWSDHRALSLVGSFAVDSTNAVIYSECARIWNPIHTDIRVAKAAGLKSTVIHGTETLSRALTIVMTGQPDNGAMASLSCRFTAKVEPGAHLEVWASELRSGVISFEVRSSDGSVAISDGLLALFH